MKNIVIIGFMGTGKTTIAKACAKRFGMEYVSTDDLIEEREGHSIREIFERKGEPYFRQVERAVVKEVAALKDAVIDCGGGVILDPENVANLRASGVLICLAARPEIILQRTRGRAHRPLLNVPDPRARVEELLAERGPFYAQANHTIDTSDENGEAILSRIANLMEE